MRVLIVHGQTELSQLWSRHLARSGAHVQLAAAMEAAVEALGRTEFDVMLLSLTLEKGSALAIADYANYRRPACRVVFVSNSQFFSDGSLFNHVGNARMMLPEDVPPEDLTAVVEHYAAH
jgi:DNA-binding NtrC family response regulator